MDMQGRLLALAGRRTAERRQSDFDLAVKVWAPAASVFKVVTAAALLGRGVTPDARICYHGGLRGLTAEHLIDDDVLDRDCDDLRGALAHSTNPVFAKLAHRHLDVQQLSDVARAFGVDRAPDFCLDSEAGRLNLPHEKLPFAQVASGFWNIEISPLAGALLSAVVASGGRALTPRLVDEVHYPDGDEQEVLSAPSRPVLTPAVADALRRMMVAAVDVGTAYTGFHDGTGRPFFPTSSVAGKTGSLTRPDPFRAYSWFVGFAPADEPKVVISVLLGNPEKWHLKAHTAARMVLRSIL
jgi:cell division protein FtsI/penicillin-binding protein 2